MHLIRVLSALLLLGLTACGTTQTTGTTRTTVGPEASGSPIIDQPTPPFPYNSRWI